MRRSVEAAVRGIVAGVAGLAFVLFLLLAQLRAVSLPVLVALFLVGVALLLVAAGPSAVVRLFGDGETSDDETAGGDGDVERSDWWLANLEPALGDSWNRWSELVLAAGLATLGFGSLVMVVRYSGEGPPVELLVAARLGINGALASVAFAFD